MVLEGLDIDVSYEESGCARGYYAIDEERLKNDLDKKMLKNMSKKKQTAFIRQFIKENIQEYLGAFEFVRDDMNKELFIDITKI